MAALYRRAESRPVISPNAALMEATKPLSEALDLTLASALQAQFYNRVSPCRAFDFRVLFKY